MKCKVNGCGRQLDAYGFPVEYCDYQQGRCPMYPKPNMTLQTVIVYVIILTLLLGVTWYTI